MRTLAIGALAGVWAGCAGPADRPEVEILRSAPAAPYVALGAVRDVEIAFEASAQPHALLQTQYSPQEYIEMERPAGYAALRRQAAKLGARAVILTRENYAELETASGEKHSIYEPAGAGHSRPTTRVLFEGLAINYDPARQPLAGRSAQDGSKLFPAAPVPVAHPAPPENASLPVDNQTTMLAPFLVSDDPVGCFGMGLQIRRDNLTNHVLTITILQVLPHGAAENAGLEPLTSIRKIDGRPVGDFIASFREGSALNGKLMGRKAGDRIVLEVLAPDSTRAKLVTLTEGMAIRSFNDAERMDWGRAAVGR